MADVVALINAEVGQLQDFMASLTPRGMVSTQRLRRMDGGRRIRAPHAGGPDVE
jgi:hypothetical protein